MSSSRNRIHIPRVTAPAWYISVAWLLLALFAQACFMHVFTIRNVEPNLVLVAVVWYAIRVEAWRAAAYGLAAGFALDLLAFGTTGGAWTIAMTAVAVFSSTISRGFFADSIPLVATITFVATLVVRLIFWVVMSFEGYPGGVAMMHFHEALFEAILNGLVMTMIILINRRFDNRYA